ncbi:MAG: thymidylate synthase [Patescibacteria group bacterium]
MTEEKPPVVNYRPYKDRTPDHQFRNIIRNVMDYGEISTPPQGEEARRLIGVQLRYPMENGFPLMTERDLTLALGGSNGEIIGFTHGERTLEGLKKYGCPEVFWARWVTAEKCAIFGLEPGDLGDGSYGMQFGKPKCEGGEFSQIEAALELARAFPNTRTIRITTWRLAHLLLNADPKKRRTVVAPCHGDFTVVLDPKKKTVRVIHRQRSADLLVGWTGNVTQYAWMGMVFAHLLGYTMMELVHYIEDAHIYASQYKSVDELFANPTKPFPTVTIDEYITDYFAFRREHLFLSDYDHGPKMVIPTPV